MTTLSLFYSCFGWNAGSMDDAKRRFAIASKDEMDRLCGQLANKIREIDNPREALWFMKHRNESVSLVIRELISK